MKKHQFEEITFTLTSILAVLCHHFEYYWLSVPFTVKAVFDLGCALYYSWKSANQSLKDKEQQ